MLWWFFSLCSLSTTWSGEGFSLPACLCSLNHVVFYGGQYFSAGVSLPSCFLSSQAVRGIQHLLPSDDDCYPACCCLISLVNCYFLTYMFLFSSLLTGKRGAVKTKRGSNSFWSVCPRNYQTSTYTAMVFLHLNSLFTTSSLLEES